MWELLSFRQHRWHNHDESSTKKTVFISYVPVTYSGMDKLFFSAANESITKHFDGIARNIQANDKDDVNEKQLPLWSCRLPGRCPEDVPGNRSPGGPSRIVGFSLTPFYSTTWTSWWTISGYIFRTSTWKSATPKWKLLFIYIVFIICLNISCNSVKVFSYWLVCCREEELIHSRISDWHIWNKNNFLRGGFIVVLLSVLSEG